MKNRKILYVSFFFFRAFFCAFKNSFLSLFYYFYCNIIPQLVDHKWFNDVQYTVIYSKHWKHPSPHLNINSFTGCLVIFCFLSFKYINVCFWNFPFIPTRAITIDGDRERLDGAKTPMIKYCIKTDMFV